MSDDDDRESALGDFDDGDSEQAASFQGSGQRQGTHFDLGEFSGNGHNVEIESEEGSEIAVSEDGDDDDEFEFDDPNAHSHRINVAPASGGGNGGFGVDIQSDDSSEPFDDDFDDDEGDFDIQEEADEEVDEELKQQLEDMKTFDEWKELSVRAKVYAIVEPALSADIEMPPKYLNFTWAYAAVYFCLTLIHVALLLTITFSDINKTATDVVFALTCGFFAVDLVIRLLFCTILSKVPMIVVDIFTLGSAVIIWLELLEDPYLEIAYYVVQFRALRLYLITRLGLHTDTFRDINLAFVTIANSAKSLSIFVCLLVVGLFLFSTAVYLLERGNFDPVRQAWYRPCADLKGCHDEFSPFQSIPDALWLIINTMTTVGLGDVTPATTAGRVVTGMAMIAGVFVIAFPTMVLVGNLTLIRKNFFREEERLKRLKEDAEIAFLEMQRANRQQTQGLMEGDFGSIPQLHISENGENDLPLPTGSLPNTPVIQSLQSMAQLGSGSLSSMRIFSPTSDTNLKPKAYFSFMGDTAREVRATRCPMIFHYQPFMAVLGDDTGRPILSGIHQIDEMWFEAQMFLVLDDPVAQEAAARAVRGGEKFGSNVFCRATPLYGLEVQFSTKLAGIKMLRRSDIGEVHDLHVPLTLRIHFDGAGGEKIDQRAEMVRQELIGAQLTITCSTQPVTSGVWYETIFITSSMLSKTPFSADLKAIAAHVSSDLLLTEEQRQAQAKHNKPGMELKRRDYAYVTKRDLQTLLQPVLAQLTAEGQVIRNVVAVMEQLTKIVALHCRVIRLSSMPTGLHTAVYGLSHVAVHEKLYEVDTDYFRTADWPIGSVKVEKAEKGKQFHVRSVIGASKGGPQPKVDDIKSFQSPFTSDVSMRTSMLRDHALDEVHKENEEQARILVEIAEKAKKRQEAQHRGADFSDLAGLGGEAGEEAVGDHDDDDDDSVGSLDEDGLTREERHQVQQKLLFASGKY